MNKDMVIEQKLLGKIGTVTDHSCLSMTAQVNVILELCEKHQANQSRLQIRPLPRGQWQ